MINKEQLRYVLSLEQPNVEEMQDIIEAAPDLLGDIIKGKNT